MHCFHLNHRNERPFWIFNDTYTEMRQIVVTLVNKRSEVRVVDAFIFVIGKPGVPGADHITLPRGFTISGIAMMDKHKKWYEMPKDRITGDMSRVWVRDILPFPRPDVPVAPVAPAPEQGTMADFVVSNDTCVVIKKVVLKITVPFFQGGSGVYKKAIIEQDINSGTSRQSPIMLSILKIPEGSIVMGISMMDTRGQWYDLPGNKLQFGMRVIEVKDILPHPRESSYPDDLVDGVTV